jgi:hypothetical protein
MINAMRASGRMYLSLFLKNRYNIHMLILYQNIIPNRQVLSKDERRFLHSDRVSDSCLMLSQQFLARTSCEYYNDFLKTDLGTFYQRLSWHLS